MPQSHPTPPLTLSDTRLDPADADDLRWLWNCSASEMGERSPMGPMIDRLREGRVGPTHIDEDTADAKALRQAAVATRVRRIEARLARVDARHRTTLKATLGPGLPPGTTEVYARMGTATLPVTLLLLTADRVDAIVGWHRAGGDLATALDAAIASTSSYSIVHVVGPMDATSFATVSTKAASAEAVKKFLLFLVEAPGQASNQTNAQWSASVISTFANSTDKRIGICAMECELTSTLNQPQAGRTMRRPLAWALAARAGSIPISEDIGRVASGPLLGVVSVYQIDQGETLDAAGFSCGFVLPDYPGFYGSGRLKSPSGSDYQLWQDMRVIDEVMRVGYKGQTRYLNDALRVREVASGQYPAGSIDPGDAQTVEAYLDGLLRDALVTPGYVTAARAIVDRTVNMVTQKLLKVKYEATPLGTIRTIDGTAGLKDPAIARL